MKKLIGLLSGALAIGAGIIIIITSPVKAAEKEYTDGASLLQPRIYVQKIIVRKAADIGLNLPLPSTNSAVY